MTAQTYNPQTAAPVTMTPAAIDHVRGQLVGQPDAKGLRFSVKSSGCSGWSYHVAPATEIRDSDVKVEVSDDLTVFVDPDSLQYIKGTEIDFVRDGLNHTFRFRNPNVDAECGCGESFSVKA